VRRYCCGQGKEGIKVKYVKSGIYTELICERFCSFYRPGKERLKCGTYSFLEKNLTPGELRFAVENMPAEKVVCDPLSEDVTIRELVCEKCDFLVGGCDFRGSQTPFKESIPPFKSEFADTFASRVAEGRCPPPCGGYQIAAWLLKGA
jgi:hypothetical protein